MPRRQRPPLSPEAAAIVRAHLLSRRGVLGGAGAVAASALLAACGTDGSDGEGKPTPAADLSEQEPLVRWVNWPEYLDYDEKTKLYPTLHKFEETTQIKATYAEDIEDNDSYYARVAGQLANGQDIGADVVVLTDWMANRLIQQGYVQKLDKGNIPNAGNLLDALVNVDFDPGRNYSLTWQSGYAGLAWNKAELAKLGVSITKVSDLWNPKLKGRVEVLTEMRDTLGMIMLEQGVDISQDFTSAQFDDGLAVLQENLESGQIRQVKGNSYLEDLASGDAIALMAWSGDILAANYEANETGDPDKDPYVFALPEHGGTLWSDNLLIPIGAPHKTNAEILMNYYFQPKVAAEVAQWVNYICPVKGAKEAMAELDPSLVDSPYIFPTEQHLAKVRVFRALSPSEDTEFSQKFAKALGL